VANEPLVLNMNGWIRENAVQIQSELVGHGPSFYVSVEPFDDKGGRRPTLNNIIAQIDPGAGATCISPRLAAKLGVPAVSTADLQIAGDRSQTLQRFQCGVIFADGTRWDSELAALPYIGEPHDVVIGRDFLAHTRLLIDFTTGSWELHIKKP
jgi:predicted aspartyl protease